MKSKLQYLIVTIGAIVSFALGGCVSTNRTIINQGYELKTTVWHMGDSGWKSSLWGRSEHGRWKEIWPSIPGCNHGKVWLPQGDNLLFVGWDKNNENNRLVLLTFGAGPAVDLSPKIIAGAVKSHLIPERLESGKDYKYDGLGENEHGIFVVLTALRQNDLEPNTKVPIPLELLMKSPGP